MVHCGTSMYLIICCVYKCLGYLWYTSAQSFIPPQSNMALNSVRIIRRSLGLFRPVSSCMWRTFCNEAEQQKTKRNASPTVTFEAVVASLRADRVTAKGLGLSRK